VLAHAFCKPEAPSGEDEGHSLIQILERAALTLDAQALGPAVERVVGALEITQSQTEQALRALEIEYNRLFVGPGRPQAPPYESCYRDKWGLVMGRSARDVERRYAEAGLELAPDHRDLPDHVATELGFMAYLATREAEAKDEERQLWVEREHLLLRDHLTVWLPLFCQRVKEASQHPFYTALAELTDTFVSLDLQWSETCHESQPEEATGQ
jgi:TorA maturation chaperone TorD